MSTDANRIIEAVRRLDDGIKRPTPKRLLDEANIPEIDWRTIWGSWNLVMIAAGLRPARIVRRVERLAGQSQIDAVGLHELDAEVKEVSGLYNDSPSTKTQQWILVASDVHDVKVDPFWLYSFLEAVRVTAGSVDTIVLDGDIWDGFEFSRHTRDFREWQLGRRIRFVHRFLEEIRARNPHAQLVMVEGNHEHWILRYFNERAPELMALFSDLHQFKDVADLLGIHRFGITYCSQARLSLPTLGQVRREINQRNWWTFKDIVKFGHYPPSDKDVTQPGINGHCHTFNLRSGFYRSDIGRFQWMQIGCGARMVDGWAIGDAWDKGWGFVEWNEHDAEQVVKMHPIQLSDTVNFFGYGAKRNHQRDLVLYGELGGFSETEISRCYAPAKAA